MVAALLLHEIFMRVAADLKFQILLFAKMQKYVAQKINSFEDDFLASKKRATEIRVGAPCAICSRISAATPTSATIFAFITFGWE